MAYLFRSLAAFMILVAFATAQSGPGQFTLAVYHPGSTLNGQIVNAAGSAFHLGIPPASYCPLVNQTLCPAGNSTIFAGMSALFVEVPGGQEIYTETSGVLSYTEPHSAFLPPGAYIGDFTNVTVTRDCGTHIYLINWQSPPNSYGISTKGILACPQSPSSTNGKATYQIYAHTPAFNRTDCIVVEGLLPHYTPSGVYGAWEYT